MESYRVELRVGRGSLLVAVLVTLTALPPAPAALAEGDLRCAGHPFVENVYPTTEHGPAAADLVLGPSYFVPCTRGDYALCYYSGAPDLPCEVDEVRGVAACACERFTASAEQPMFVDITGILNTCVYIETVGVCGVDGSGCGAPDSAPVCDYLARNTLIPGADLISTFSFRKVGDYQLGCHDCTDRDAVYAGCMTAPCHERGAGDGDTVVCDCPLVRGPYQFGRRGDWTCDAGDGLVWSAAYNPDGCSNPLSGLPGLPSALASGGGE